LPVACQRLSLKSQLPPMLLSTRLILFITLTCSVTIVCAQQSIIFEDDFNDNRNNWKLVSNSQFAVTIKDSALHIQKYEKNFISRGCLWLSKEIPGFNTSTDFSITFYAKMLSSDDLFSLIDFQWGFRNDNGKNINGRDSLYQANFILDGRVDLDYFDKKWNYLYKTSLPDTAVKLPTTSRIVRRDNYPLPYQKDQFNKFEIIQKGDNCIIKVNDMEVLNKPIRRIYGNSIGIQHCLKSAWQMDRIVIRQDNWY
jgi:hypothetical protein